MDEVSIPVSLLEELKDTVESAYYFTHVLDLADAYRKTQKVPKASPMTNRLSAATEVLATFINLAEEEEAEPDAPSSDTE